MDPKLSFKVGDKIVDYGHIYRIFEITKDDKNGDSDRILHFRPFFSVDITKDVVCSIPESSITDTTIRLPVKPKDIRGMITRLTVKPRYTEVPDAQDIKDLLNENDPEKVVDIIRILSAEKKKELGFTKSKSDILQLSKSHLVQEVALVLGIPLEKAERKVELALERPYKN
ncbi:hypothetical protein ACFL2C_03615 [Patescibacteria group bacterium]